MATQPQLHVPNGLVGMSVTNAGKKCTDAGLKLGIAQAKTSTTFSPVGDSGTAEVTDYANSTPAGGEISPNGTVGVVIVPPQNTGG